MRSFRDLPIRQKLGLGIVGTSITALLLAFVVLMTFEWVNERQRMANDLRALTYIIGANSTGALTFNDAAAAAETLSALRARPQILMACIYSKPLGIGAFAGYWREDVEQACPTAPPAPGMVATQNLLTVVAPVMLEGEMIGSLYIERSLGDLWLTARLYVVVVFGVLAACILVAWLMSRVMQRFIAEPILGLAQTTSRVAATKDYSIRAPSHGEDEVGQLVAGFNDMLGQISQRDQALQNTRSELVQRVDEIARANAELQSAMSRLQETQDQLVQQEKMASLGALVAGIAHEINTPVGVGVTAASTLSARAATLREDFESGALTKSQLNKFVETAGQATEIILANLNRASELIQSFKQVAVDQSSSERRRFRVKAYLNEILLSLRPELKRTNLRVELHCDDQLEIATVPGALSQVMTNLVMNSLLHAYDEGQAGLITIDVDNRDGLLHLRFSDDGKGIPRENLTRVFDPFFTTRRGSGGSGLGMHIVYNLVTQQLSGTVRVQSEPGRGTTIEITMPAGQEPARKSA